MTTVKKSPSAKFDAAAAAIFDVEPSILPAETPLLPAATANQENSDDNSEVDKDFELIRQNLLVIIERGMSSIEYAIDLCKDSENLRGFEQVSNLIKSVTDANLQILEARERVKRLSAKEKEQSVKAETNITNAVMVTTDQLNRLLDQRNKNATT